jgi:hypothetical protein
MDANDFTFGCEFEVTFPRDTAPMAGGYLSGRSVDGLPSGWIAKTDTSITPKRGYVGIEIVSPILRGSDGLAQVQSVCKWLNEQGAIVNDTTGFHVHVGFDRTDTKGLSRLLAFVANHEKAIFATTGTKTRENNRFCKGVRESAEAKTIYANGLPRYADRYHVLNVANLANGVRPTVEFRAFAGTCSSLKAIGYIRMCVGFVQRSCTETRGRKFGRKYPESLNNGVAAVKRLIKFLGWSGKNSSVWGGIEAEGIPTMKECSKELLRLASKYDGPAA